VRRRSGLTLIELIVVLVILVALAALVVPMIGTSVTGSEVDVTFQTMQRLRDAIMGGNGNNIGYFADMKGLPIPGRPDTYGLPNDVRDLLTTTHYVSPGPPLFNVQTQRGWRGPYISQGVSGSLLEIRDSFPNGGQPGSAILIQTPPVGTPGMSEIQRQNFVRLVSLGPNGTAGIATTPATAIWDPRAPTVLSANNWEDDIILYVRRDVPGMDWTNYWEQKKAMGH